MTISLREAESIELLEPESPAGRIALVVAALIGPPVLCPTCGHPTCVHPTGEHMPLITVDEAIAILERCDKT